MKAIVYHRYGSPDVLELQDVERPELTDDTVLVRVHAASVNPVDWYTMAGSPYVVRMDAGLRGPKTGRLGVDFAGTVEAVGRNVTGLHVGDEVYGGRSGAFAEYVTVRDAVVRKPANLSFEEAAAVPIAATTALQGLRDKGRIQQGQKVLINGASGGVGTFAVQIAKSFGAEVTAVCSTQNVEAARSLGADEVVDYTRDDFTAEGPRYDLLLDIAGNRSWTDCKRVLNRDGVMVAVGAKRGNRFVGPLAHMIGTRLASIGGSRRVVPFVAKLEHDDLVALSELLEDGTVTPVVDRRYELSEVPEALRYLGDGHARGKVVITV